MMPPMNRIKVYTCALIFLTVLGIAGLGRASAESLYNQFGRQGLVKVYVADPVDTTQEKKVDLKDLKAKFEEALKNRKSIRFEVVPTREAAQIAVDCQVSELYWTDHDPVDMLMGAASAAYDAMTVEAYARMQAAVTVADVKQSRTIWEDKLIATVTKKDMSQADSAALINEDMAKGFVRACFGKGRK